MPGKSTILIGSGSFLYKPSFLATVTPGQLPVCAVEPVKELNKVVFPELGLPIKAKCFILLVDLHYN